MSGDDAQVAQVAEGITEAMHGLSKAIDAAKRIEDGCTRLPLLIAASGAMRSAKIASDRTKEMMER